MGAEFIPVIEDETFDYMGCDRKHQKEEEVADSDTKIKVENGQESAETSQETTQSIPFQEAGSDLCFPVPPPPPPYDPPPPPPPQPSWRPLPPALPPQPPPPVRNESPPFPPPPPPESPVSSSTELSDPSNVFNAQKASSIDSDSQSNNISSENKDLVQVNGWNQEAKDDEEMETCSYEDEAFVEEDDESEDESPMFEV